MFINKKNIFILILLLSLNIIYSIDKPKIRTGITSYGCENQ